MFTTQILNINTDSIVDKVFRLQQYWIPRSDEFPFYTLGRCTYLDGKTPAYHEEIKTLNPILLKEFGDTYHIIIDYLSNQFKKPIELNSSLAHPSFHIFISSPFLLTHAGLWHQDYPHLTLDLGDVDPYSFTIAIKLPTGGGGLDFIDNNKQKYLPYQEGSIIGHSGEIIHRMASLKKYIPDEYRITMQGHLIRINGVLTMFW